MMIKKFNIFSILFFIAIIFVCATKISAQTRIDTLEIKLDSLITEIPGLNHPIELSVSNIPLNEFVRNIASLTDLNINLSTDNKQTVTNNFVNVPAKDVLLFLCKYFNLELEFTGNIINVSEFKPPVKEYIPKELKIEVDSLSKAVSFDLKRDSLVLFAKQFTQLTGINTIFEPTLTNKTLSVYVLKLSIEEALDKLAISNNLKVTKKDSSFIIGQHIIENKTAKSNNRKNTQKKNITSFNYKVYDQDHMDVYGNEVSIHEAIVTISKKINLNYFIVNDISGNTDLNLSNVTYQEFLDNILKGTNYTASINNGIYLIGERGTEGIRENKIIPLTYRSVIDISAVIPENITEGVSVKEFPDLNSLIVSGSVPAIREVETFIKKIDKVVPLVLIELIIIDNNSGYTIETGISLGIAESPTTSSGQSFPDMNYNMGANSMNSLLNSFNGFGVFNLGKVNPNFYMNIKAMEDEGLVKVRSTPKLSTLNGHEAELTIGNTEYYKEEMTNFIVSQSTQQRTNTQYKAVTADFILKILPVVAGNDEITLNISVEQSDFTGRIEKNAPPGKVTRKFNSLIRVKNEETVLLGGLEEKKLNDSSRGVPLLSRIPILKWIFSNRKKAKSESKLNVFIKPTIIY